MSVKEIAFAAGYKLTSALIRQFKKRYRLTPSDCRRHLQARAMPIAGAVAPTAGALAAAATGGATSGPS